MPVRVFEQRRLPAPVALDLVFEMMADIGMFNREYPRSAIAPNDVVLQK